MSHSIFVTFMEQILDLDKGREEGEGGGEGGREGVSEEGREEGWGEVGY